MGENGGGYVGSTKNMKNRWSSHKSDIRHGRYTACGLTEHFGKHHQQNYEAAISCLEVTLVDSTDSELSLKVCEDRWILNMGTLFKGFNKKDEVLSNNRKQFG